MFGANQTMSSCGSLKHSARKWLAASRFEVETLPKPGDTRQYIGAHTEQDRRAAPRFETKCRELKLLQSLARDEQKALGAGDPKALDDGSLGFGLDAFGDRDRC
jgi:hypothetical protein